MIRVNARDLARLQAQARNGKPAATGLKAAKPRGAPREGGADAMPGPEGAQVPAARTRRRDVVEPGPRGGRMARTLYQGESIEVGFDLAPQPKERARTFADYGALARAFARANGDPRRFMAAIKAPGEGGIMRSVTPEATRNFEEAAALVATQAMAAAHLEPYTCPLEMIVEFRFAGALDEWPTGYQDGDLDNLEKALKDALNKVAYQDDRLVVRKTSIKSCSPTPGITMLLRPAAP